MTFDRDRSVHYIEGILAETSSDASMDDALATVLVALSKRHVDAELAVQFRPGTTQDDVISRLSHVTRRLREAEPGLRQIAVIFCDPDMPLNDAGPKVILVVGGPGNAARDAGAPDGSDAIVLAAGGDRVAVFDTPATDVGFGLLAALRRSGQDALDLGRTGHTVVTGAGATDRIVDYMAPFLQINPLVAHDREGHITGIQNGRRHIRKVKKRSGKKR